MTHTSVLKSLEKPLKIVRCLCAMEVLALLWTRLASGHWLENPLLHEAPWASSTACLQHFGNNPQRHSLAKDLSAEAALAIPPHFPYILKCTPAPLTSPLLTGKQLTLHSALCITQTHLISTERPA